MSKQKILMITPTYYPIRGGAEKVVYEMCNYLSSYYDIDLITLDFKGSSKKNDKKENFKIHRVCREVDNKYIKFIKYQYHIHKKARELFSKNRYDLIHVHYLFPNLFTTFFLKKEFNLLVLVTEHHFGTGMDISSHKENPVYANFLMKMFANKFEHYATTGKTQNQFLKYLGVDKSKIETIHLGGDCDISSKGKKDLYLDLKLDKSKKYIFSISRIVDRKKYDDLIEAVRILSNIRKDIIFLVAGKGPQLENMKKKVKKYKLNDQIKFLGFQSDKEVSKLRKVSDAFVTFSEFEGAGIMYFEAFCSNLAVFARENVASKEAITNNKNGFLFKTPVEFVDKLLDNIDNTKKLNSISKAGQDLFQSRYNWQRHNSKYKEYYESIIKK